MSTRPLVRVLLSALLITGAACGDDVQVPGVTPFIPTYDSGVFPVTPVDGDLNGDGAGDGLADGAGDGFGDGAGDGFGDGAGDGLADGAGDGLADGGTDGDADGDTDGDADGSADGDADGSADGDADGSADGDADGSADGDADGSADGDADGSADGDADGSADGDADGSDDNFVRGPEPTKESASSAGEYTVEKYTDGFRDGPLFADATVWYPADAEAPFAIVAVVPGWVSSQADIWDWGPFLASHGIVNITIGTNSPVTDLPEAREAALMDALATLGEENTRTGSPLKGKLDLTRRALIGWSMGGGGALLAGSHNPDLKAVISLCGWGGYFDEYEKSKVPSLMFAGTLDVLAGGQSQGFYEAIPNTTPKILYEVNGGDHWVSNDPAHENGQIGLYGLSWLKVFLEGDDRYEKFLGVKPTNVADWRVNLP